jgi:ribulose-5-phosphate 4-epimerase/fuculose-1-phosphate aldolase
MSAASATANLQAVIDDLVVANHILANEGVVDGFGHISARHPNDPALMLIARSMAPALVQVADILVYRARPDVHSVIHTHSPAIVPFGVTGGRLRPICHMSGFLGATTPVYDIRHSAGAGTDLLISSQTLGRDLAKVLGANQVALLRGHGNVVVGHSIQQSVFRAIYTESNAKLQLQAMQLAQLQGQSADSVEYLSIDEAQATSDMNDLHLGRPWEMWKRRVEALH